MAKIKRKINIILIIIGFMLAVLLFVIFAPIGEYNSNVQKGNFYYYNSVKPGDGSLKVFSYKYYAQAEKDWPILKINYLFQNKYLDAKKITKELIESRPALTVFFKKGTSQEDINTLISDLKQKENVKVVKYISSEESLRIYREKNKKDPVLLDLVTADILPASIEVYVNDSNNINDLKKYLQSKNSIEQVVVNPLIKGY